ncbi:MAG TPA: phosphohistidine phosphatase SixA [Candidatus Obscuribacterales bacterium]
MALSPQTDLYFIRHGIAAERGTYANDGDRPLTPKGEARTQAVAQRLVELGCTVDLILTSPLVRAQQTAQILLAAGLAPTLNTEPALAPEGALADWLSWLTHWQTQQPHSTLALVGHEPDLSHWAQQLVGGHSSDRWQLKKAGIIGVQVPAAAAAIGHSELFWLVPPRLLL